MPHTGVWTELSRPHIRIPEAPLKQTTRLCSHSSNSVLLGWGPKARISDNVQVGLLLVLRATVLGQGRSPKVWALHLLGDCVLRQKHWSGIRRGNRKSRTAWKLAQKLRIF